MTLGSQFVVSTTSSSPFSQSYLARQNGRMGRGLVALTFVVTMVSLTSPGTAYAKHGNGAAIALGILGGARRRNCFFNRARVLRSGARL